MYHYKQVLVVVLSCCYLILSGFTVVGHRGDPVDAPEETFESFDYAFSNGADYVELDLHESQDGVLVISHDRDLKRVTGTEQIVSQANFGDLQNLKQANGEPIHSLEELFQNYQARPNTKFIIETKKTKHGNPSDMEAKLVALIQQYHMQDRVIVHSFSLSSLQTMKQLLPEVPRIFIVGSLKRITFEALPDVDGINISSTLVNEELVSQLHALDKKVYVWDEMNENPDKWKWLINLNIDGVVTNYVKTAAHYNNLKTNAKIDETQTTANLIGENKAQTWENPYQPVLTNKPARPNHNYEVSNKVTTNGQTYYQLATNRFVKATEVNIGYQADIAHQLLNRSIKIKPNSCSLTTKAYKEPSVASSISGDLIPNRTYQIHAVKFIDHELWVKTIHGWVENQNYLFTLNPLGSKTDYSVLYLEELNRNYPDVPENIELPGIFNRKISTKYIGL